MKTLKLILAATTATLGLATVSSAQQPYLNEIIFFEGTGTGGYNYNAPGYPTPITGISVPGVNASGLNGLSGLGSITYNSSALGAQYFGVYFNIDNDLVNSTAFWDAGSASGTPSSGQTWEIGDNTLNNTYDDANNDTLANANTIAVAPPFTDVALALGFDFDNTVPGTETITVTSSLKAPSSGFYLEEYNQQDTTNGLGYDMPNYLYATESFTPSGPPGVPDGGPTVSVLAMGLMALTGLKYRFTRK
jgi:hypothetical protein